MKNNNLSLHGCDFEISLTDFGQKNTICANFVGQENINLHHLESSINDNKQLKCFINKILKLTGIKEMPKILNLMVQIHQYYGGQQVFSKNKNLGYVLESDGLEMFDYNFNNLADILSALISIKTKIKSEKLKFFISDLIDSLN